MSKKDDIYSQEYLQHDRLQERRRFALEDISGRGMDVEFEINWNSFARRTGCILLSIDGKEAVIDRDQLWSILFILGSAEEQEKLVTPFMRQTKVSKFFKMIGITASRDIRKGEFINVPLEFTLNPETNRVIIGKGNMGQLQKRVSTGRGQLL